VSKKTLGRWSEANDAWDQVRGGFRLDWDITEATSFTLQGDYYDRTKRHEFANKEKRERIDTERQPSGRGGVQHFWNLPFCFQDSSSILPVY
jgi:hypothetical protein